MTRMDVVRSSAVLVAIALAVGVLAGYFLGSAQGLGLLETGEPFKSGSPDTLPQDFKVQLDRFVFVNRSSNQTLNEFRVFGRAVGTYVEGGEVFESYAVGFEDRYGGAKADLDSLDLMVKLKHVRGSSEMTVRIAQLGLDAIDVYLDGQFMGSVRPVIEVQIRS